MRQIHLKPVRMIQHGGPRPSMPPGVHRIVTHALALQGVRLVLLKTPGYDMMAERGLCVPPDGQRIKEVATMTASMRLR